MIDLDTSVTLPDKPALPDNGHGVVQLLCTDQLVVVITAGSIQIWSGGQHRICLSRRTRSAGDVRTEGSYKRAYWSAARRLIAIVVRVILYVLA